MLKRCLAGVMFLSASNYTCNFSFNAKIRGIASPSSQKMRKRYFVFLLVSGYPIDLERKFRLLAKVGKFSTEINYRIGATIIFAFEDSILVVCQGHSSFLLGIAPIYKWICNIIVLLW